MSPNADSESKLWMMNHTQTINPSSSTSSGPSQLRHVTPIRPARFMCMPFPPKSLRIIPSNPDTREPPVRPSPPSPLEDRHRWNPAHPMFEPDTRFDSSSPIFSSELNRMMMAADSSMEWRKATPPAPEPVVRALTPWRDIPTPHGSPPIPYDAPNGVPRSAFVAPAQPPAIVFDSDTHVWPSTPRPVPPSSSTLHRAPTSQPVVASEWPSTPHDGPTPPASQVTLPQIVVTPPQGPISDGDNAPSTAPIPSENERRPMFNDPPDLHIFGSYSHSSPPPGAFASVPPEFLAEYQRTLRARVINRPSTPRYPAWDIDMSDSDDSPVAPPDRSPNLSPLALNHATTEIDGLFRNANLGYSFLDLSESTAIWVDSERTRSGQVSDIEDGDTSVNPSNENTAGDVDAGFTTTSNRGRRSSHSNGKVYDGQGDRVAPSAGPSGRKRELSGGGSKAGPSHQGTPEHDKRKRRKMKGKGKENLDLQSTTDY